MRFLLKTKTGISSMYWVTGGSNSVFGWYGGDAVRPKMGLAGMFMPDFHFHYPSSGEYHLSFKSPKGTPEIYVNVYHDRAKVKTISEKIPNTANYTVEEFSATEFGQLGRLMVGYLPPAFNDIDIFQFPLMGLNVFDGDCLWNGPLIPKAHVREDDLLLDVSCLREASVNVSAHIRRSTRSLATNDPKYKEFFMHQQISDTHCVELVCRTKGRLEK